MKGESEREHPSQNRFDNARWWRRWWSLFEWVVFGLGFFPAAEWVAGSAFGSNTSCGCHEAPKETTNSQNTTNGLFIFSLIACTHVCHDGKKEETQNPTPPLHPPPPSSSNSDTKEKKKKKKKKGFTVEATASCSLRQWWSTHPRKDRISSSSLRHLGV